MQTEISLGLLGCVQVGRNIDDGDLAPEMISMIKRNSCGKNVVSTKKNNLFLKERHWISLEPLEIFWEETEFRRNIMS